MFHVKQNLSQQPRPKNHGRDDRILSGFKGAKTRKKRRFKAVNERQFTHDIERDFGGLGKASLRSGVGGFGEAAGLARARVGGSAERDPGAGRSIEIGDIRASIGVFVFAGAAAEMEGARGIFLPRVLVRGVFEANDDGRKRNRLPAITTEYATVPFHFHLLNHGKNSPLKFGPGLSRRGLILHLRAYGV
ncbi:MAG: hypothetical protein ACLQMT_10605 [Candidatus Acidiferrales bacterium]